MDMGALIEEIMIECIKGKNLKKEMKQVKEYLTFASVYELGRDCEYFF